MPATTDAPEAANDMGLAEGFLAANAQDVRYASGRGWFVWTGERWAPDERCAVAERMKATADRLRRAKAHNPLVHKQEQTWAMRAGDNRNLTSALTVALSDPRVRVEASVFDCCPYLLNVANGTIDLRTGDLRKARRGDYITKLVPVEYHPDADAPRWLRFLAEAVPDDATRDHLQVWSGYCATGESREQVFHVHHGAGANGKSTC